MRRLRRRPPPASSGGGGGGVARLVLVSCSARWASVCAAGAGCRRRSVHPEAGTLGPMPRWTCTLMIAALATSCDASADEYAAVRTQISRSVCRGAGRRYGLGRPGRRRAARLSAVSVPAGSAARARPRRRRRDRRVPRRARRGAVHVRSLRRAWLEDLARRRQWETYLEHYDDDRRHQRHAALPRARRPRRARPRRRPREGHRRAVAHAAQPSRCLRSGASTGCARATP